jgi:hypothetical protein
MEVSLTYHDILVLSAESKTKVLTGCSFRHPVFAGWVQQSETQEMVVEQETVTGDIQLNYRQSRVT